LVLAVLQGEYFALYSGHKEPYIYRNIIFLNCTISQTPVRLRSKPKIFELARTGVTIMALARKERLAYGSVSASSQLTIQ
jgi:hypothetical protein